MNTREAAKLEAQLQGSLDVARLAAKKCYCPGDCNCRFQGEPWRRFNYCGCKAHEDAAAMLEP